MSGVRQRLSVPVPDERLTRLQASPTVTAAAAKLMQYPDKADAPAPAVAVSAVPSWFSLVYWLFCGGVIIGSAISFAFWPSYFHSHLSYDPMVSLPALPRREVMTWYFHHDAESEGTTSGAAPVRAMLEFFNRFQHANFFTPEGANTPAFEHYQQALTEGWVAGVFEGACERAVNAAEPRIAAVRDQPSGERKTKEALAAAVSDIVQVLYDGDAAATVDGSSSAPSANWTTLATEHQSWVMEGLSHCDTDGCRMLKMQLARTWQNKLDEQPAHPSKDQWKLTQSLFHPLTHGEDSQLIDAPATVQTLSSLWYRFFGSGNPVYVRRLVELTALLGGPAYQEAKDAETRTWWEGKQLRRQQDHDAKAKAAQEEAAKTGKPAAPVEPLTPLKPLPASPTRELYSYYVAALKYYSRKHPAVREAVHHQFALHPQDPVLQTLAKDPWLNTQRSLRKKRLPLLSEWKWGIPAHGGNQ